MSFSYAPTLLRETLGAKLRRLALKAASDNPLTRAALVAPPAWASAAAVSAGEVRSNAGAWYVAVSSGVTGASPPIHTNGQAVTDGTVMWTYYGGAVPVAAGVDVPTVTVNTSNPSASLPNAYQAVGQSAAFKVYGGYPVAYRSTAWQINGFNAAAATPANRGASVAFMTDAAKFAVMAPANAGGVRVMIDGVYYSPSCWCVAGSDTWIVFDYSALGSHRVRRVDVEGNRSLPLQFGGVQVSGSDQVWSPASLDDVRAMWIADSIWAGSAYGPFIPGATVPQRVGKLLGWSDNWGATIGGTGWLATNSGANYTYRQRIPEALTRNPDIWLFMGSTNDIGQTAAAITAEALATFQAIRAGGSTAPIVVLGVWPLNNAGVPGVEAAVQAAVTQFADPLGKTYFVPIYADPLEPWVTGSWNNSAHNTANTQALYISGDATHPPDIGTAYLAQRIARALRDQVLSRLV